jgi:hypothetical protein
MLQNSSFEDGYYHWHGVGELAIPNRWAFWYADESQQMLPGQSQPFRRPETVVWRKSDASERDRTEFFLHGNYIWKCFGAWKPIHVRLWQTVNLQAGTKYELKMPVFPDLVEAYRTDGSKRFAGDAWAGESRLIVLNGLQPLYSSGWQNANQMPFGKWSILTTQFTPTTTSVSCVLELRAKWGIPNNGFFVDKISLNAMSGQHRVWLPLITR